ncbi:hypothetical protein LCGC14_0792950 [marine sediment metagenome]|uniref:Uncharacterized protein n=1 Tax=marine sediment metagenome TaxID=412755 RepID=A0A0F9PRY5_9ZZZZ
MAGFLGISRREWVEAFSTGGLSLILNKEEPMTKKHDRHHVHCEHAEVAFCGHCDVAYCKSCKQEWGVCQLNHNPYWYITPDYTKPYCGTTTITPTVTTTGTFDISGDVLVGASDHAH